jgi:hypothetical protein
MSSAYAKIALIQRSYGFEAVIIKIAAQLGICLGHVCPKSAIKGVLFCGCSRLPRIDVSGGFG